jgi:GNAT superfamily N-acetyltransferase
MIRIRAMRTDDAAPVATLSEQLGYPSTESDVRRRFAGIEGSADAAALVAESGEGQILGWVHVFAARLVESDPYVEVGGLVVAERSRGQGVGRALMAAAEEWAAATGCATIRLRSNVLRDDAHRFYAHIGYERVKTQHTFRKRVR